MTFVKKLKTALDYMWIATDGPTLRGTQGREASISLEWIDTTASSAHRTVMGLNAKGEEFNILDEATRLVGLAKKRADRAGRGAGFPVNKQIKTTFKKLYLQSQERSPFFHGNETLTDYLDLFEKEAEEAVASKILADPTYLAMLDHVKLNIKAVQAYADADTYQRVLNNIVEGRATEEELRTFGLALVVSDEKATSLCVMPFSRTLLMSVTGSWLLRLVKVKV